MADTFQNTLAVNTAQTLTGLTEGGRCRVAADQKLQVEQELSPSGGGTWQVIYEGLPIPAADIGYVGTKLRITNIGSATANVRVNQL